MLKAIPALAALAVTLMLVTPTVSQAAETDGFRVSYADLNLASDGGQHVLQRRIAHGARVVCVIEDSRELALSTETNSCRSDAIARAQPAYEAAVASARQGIVTVGAAAALIVSAQ